MIIRTRAFPRAALIGNPSDGYHGKTIAFVFSNYEARVMLYESPELDLLPSLRDHSTFESIEHLCEDVSFYGYYGGIRLLKAAIRKFHDYCVEHGHELDRRNFTIRYQTTIPNRLGLAGSSAIITATMRALAKFYGIEIPLPLLANLVLSVERDELGIPAGLQDRVAQSYNTPVYMDFDREHMAQHGVGRYHSIEIPDSLNCYIAYRTDLAEGSEVLHSQLREDYENGIPAVRAAMLEWANLTDQVREALEARRFEKLGALLNRNFDLRCEVCAGAVSPKNRRMVELARSAGASAKFTGSGGAIIGTYEDEAMFERLRRTLGENQIDVIKPDIVRDLEMAYCE